MTVHIVLDHVALHRLLRSPTGAVARDVLRRGHNVRNRAQQLVKTNTGRLKSSIYVRLVPSLGGVAVHVGSDLDYARFVHDGTGVFGPRGRPITPRRGSVLVFNGASGRIFTRSSIGQTPNPFLRLAITAAR